MKPMALAERCAVLTENEGWFGSAAPDFQQAVLSHCEWREVMAGQPIYSASDVQTDPSGIVDGSVEIYSRYGAGDNPMLHLGHEGSWIGYGAAVRGQPLRVTTVAPHERPARLRAVARNAVTAARATGVVAVHRPRDPRVRGHRDLRLRRFVDSGQRPSLRVR